MRTTIYGMDMDYYNKRVGAAAMDKFEAALLEELRNLEDIMPPLPLQRYRWMTVITQCRDAIRNVREEMNDQPTKSS